MHNDYNKSLSATQEPLDILMVTEDDNLAESLDEETLSRIGSEAVTNYQIDLKTRAEWETLTDEWLKLATQVVETKNTPWVGASNVKFPILTVAAMQFHARAYPSIVPSNQPVVGRPVGRDPDGIKADRASNIGKHMSYQLLHEMEEWEEGMDKLLISLPLVGCYFKKTYRSALLGRNVSELVSPKDLVINYWAESLETARRKTHRIFLHKNDIIERQRAGIYLDCDLGNAPTITDEGSTRRLQSEINGMTPPSADPDIPYLILEQHAYLDLDDDGYEEPYIITVHKDTRKVLRISPRFYPHDITLNLDGDIQTIKPLEYFTKYGFIPNPDGGFYDMGFNLLLGPLTASINTILNQLIDAGTLANMQGGFLARGIRLKKGEARFQPGEWKQVGSTSTDLRKGIVPLPTKDPSGVLFNLLGMLIDSARQVSSVTDIMVGESPGQNTPATTTMAVLEQGQKVFTSIYKRIHKALNREYRKLFRLNSEYLSDVEYFTTLDLGSEEEIRIHKSDYDVTTADVVPYSDPTTTSQTQKLLKVQALLDANARLGVFNPMEIGQRFLEATEQPNPDALALPEPAPDQKLQLAAAQQEWTQEKERVELQIELLKAETDRLKVMSLIQTADIKNASTELHDMMDMDNMSITKIRDFLTTTRGMHESDRSEQPGGGLEESPSDDSVPAGDEGGAPAGT